MIEGFVLMGVGFAVGMAFAAALFWWFVNQPFGPRF